MPIIEVYLKTDFNLIDSGERIRTQVSNCLGINKQLVWMRIQKDLASSWVGPSTAFPIVFMNCRSAYSKEQVVKCLNIVRNELGHELKVPAENIFCGARRLLDGEVLSPKLEEKQ